MKKFLLAAIAALTLGSFAQANDGVLFKFKDGQAGGVVGDTITYVYQKDSKDEISGPSEAKVLAHVAKKKVCSDKAIIELMETSGLSIQYMYITDNSVAVVIIDDCK